MLWLAAPDQDAEDEGEQARVKGQAQALLDCAADLVAQAGLQSAVDLLQVRAHSRHAAIPFRKWHLWLFVAYWFPDH